MSLNNCIELSIGFICAGMFLYGTSAILASGIWRLYNLVKDIKS